MVYRRPWKLALLVYSVGEVGGGGSNAAASTGTGSGSGCKGSKLRGTLVGTLMHRLQMVLKICLVVRVRGTAHLADMAEGVVDGSEGRARNILLHRPQLRDRVPCTAEPEASASAGGVGVAVEIG
jgi:hypothetical protein